MQCRKVQSSLVAARLAHEPLAAEAQRHLAACSACQRFAARDQALDGLLAGDTDESPRPGFDTRFFARLASAGGQARTARRLRWWGLGALAGTAVVAVALVIDWRGRAAPDVDAPDIALAMSLDLMEDYEIVNHLDEIEDLEIVAQLGPDELPDEGSGGREP
jgi:hypothetical protein